MNTTDELYTQIWVSDDKNNKPSIDEFIPVQKESYRPNKPKGGMWTSTYTPNKEFDSNWIRWFVKEEYNCGNHKWKLFPKENIDVLVVNSKSDLISIVDKYEKNIYKGEKSSRIPNAVLDFKKISEDFDAIRLTKEGQEEMDFFEYPNLYSWDTETVLNLKWNWSDYKYIGQVNS